MENINLDEELIKAIDDMHCAEKPLIEIGFSQDHWTVIRSYIDAAIRRTVCDMGKVSQHLLPNSGSNILNL